jgi:hypothetical protein
MFKVTAFLVLSTMALLASNIASAQGQQTSIRASYAVIEYKEHTVTQTGPILRAWDEEDMADADLVFYLDRTSDGYYEQDEVARFPLKIQSMASWGLTLFKWDSKFNRHDTGHLQGLNGKNVIDVLGDYDGGLFGASFKRGWEYLRIGNAKNILITQLFSPAEQDGFLNGITFDISHHYYKIFRRKDSADLNWNSKIQIVK